MNLENLRGVPSAAITRHTESPFMESNTDKKTTLVRANALVFLGLNFFEEDDVKNLCGDVYQTKASII